MAENKPSRRPVGTPDSYGPLPPEKEELDEHIQAAVDRFLHGQPDGGR